MREEANCSSEASSHSASSTSMPTTAANPLLESSSSVPQRPTGTVRNFDYYADPMAAFSGNKRTNNRIYQSPTPSYPSGPSNFYPIPPPSHHQPRRTFESTPAPISWRSPVAPPFPGPPPGAWNRPGGAGGHAFPSNSSFRSYGGAGSGHEVVSPPFHGNLGPPPGAWNRPGGAGGYGFPSNSSFGDYGGTGSGHGVCPGPSPRRPSPRPYPRRGSNFHTFNNRSNPGSGRDDGRERRSDACTSARERPEMFYNKSMMEDPWKFLEPVVRKLNVN